MHPTQIGTKDFNYYGLGGMLRHKYEGCVYIAVRAACPEAIITPSSMARVPNGFGSYRRPKPPSGWQRFMESAA